MNSIRKIVLLVQLLFSGVICFGQLENVIVERYYVSDANDATDNIGGGLEEGSVTYRVYVDLEPGARLTKLFGSTGLPFSISSTEVFFNNLSDGETFAKDFIRARYEENTVALDTWLTLGQTTRKQGPITHFGILKSQDDNGSFVGGVNNDGGSEAIATGLLINEDPSIGVPLTIADGMDTLVNVPADWFSFGILDFISGEDTTMFGSVEQKSFFYRENFELSNTGVVGVIPDSNQVIVAQLTTKGDLNFVMNIEVEYYNGTEWVAKEYIGTNNPQNENQEYSPFLTYPPVCGCTDPNFIEYNPAFVCNAEGACVTPVVLGCTDPLACNYDPTANLNLAELCCYPGACEGRDLEAVCPQLKGESFDLNVFPNPTENVISINVISGVPNALRYQVLNAYGTVISEMEVENPPLNYVTSVDLESYPSGIYYVKVFTDLGNQSEILIKL